MKCNVKEMCLEAAFKTDKSLRQSDRLQETVPDYQIGNRTDSISELGSCSWNSEDCVAGGMKMLSCKSRMYEKRRVV